MTFLAFMALLLPGLAWWAWLGKRDEDPMVSLAQIIGISFALIVMLAEAIFFLGGRFSTAGIILLEILFGTLAALGIIKRRSPALKPNWQIIWIGLPLFAAVIAWRLYQARSLLLPAWVDSQHHYLITRVILEQRGLPQTLQPYLPNPFYYHYGFHAINALFTTISGLEIGAAILILGQVLNATISLSLYALGKALWKDWRPALGAALLAGFVTRMPAYYLSWGRYTLLTGLVLLTIAMATALKLKEGSNRKQNTLTLALLTAGVLLSHYFAAVLLAIFLVLIAIVLIIRQLVGHQGKIKNFTALALGTIAGLFMASPWLTRVLAFSNARTGVNLNLPETIGEIVNNTGKLDYILKLLGPTSNHWLMGAAGLGLILALVKKKSFSFLLWSALLALLTLPWILTLGPFRPDHFAIILFIPICLMAGWLFWQIGFVLDKWTKQHWLQTAILVIFVLAWMIWAFPFSKDIVNPVTVLVTEDDIEALEWIKDNTPPDARFFINTAYWLSDIYRGVDGGGWLLPYAGRWALVPTVFYGFTPDLETSRQLLDWGKRASQITTCSTEFWQLAEEAKLDWIYIREGAGSLQAEGLAGCEDINLVYNNNQIIIYQVIHR
jgi:hypothetical protein